MFNNIRIVLLNTTHPGNIGATARAMKNMGFMRLYLVAPKHFPNSEAESRASGALDVLNQAKIFSTVEEAIADCSLVIGTSARMRSLPVILQEPRESAKLIRKESSVSQVAILFGEERIGLTNEQLSHCHYQVMIPTNPDYSSLNLAAAVQLLTYELRIACLHHKSVKPEKIPTLATAAEMEAFYQHLETVLIKKNFINANSPNKVMSKLKRLFTRARPEHDEVNILRGVLKATEK